jgi:hypothetical protein
MSLTDNDDPRASPPSVSFERAILTIERVAQQTDELTLYTGHAKRGCDGIDAAGVLPDFDGVAVHDGWAPYRTYTKATHALCPLRRPSPARTGRGR